MFAVPIDNTGLASFVPVRRQSGSSVGLQDFGFNVFGQKIRRPDEADDTFIGGTDIGQIPQTSVKTGDIEQAQVLAPGLAGFIPPRRIDGGFDEESFPEGPPPSEIDINIPGLEDISETIGDKISEFEGTIADIIDNPFSFDPDEGLLGRGQFLGQEFDVAQKGTEFAIDQGLTALLGKNAFIAAPLVDLASKAIFEGPEQIEGRDIAFAGAKGIAAIALGPIGPLVVSAIQALISLFSDPDYDGGADAGPGGAGSPAGGAVDAAMGGLGIQFSEGPKYGFWTGLTDAGFEDPDEPAFTDDYSDFGTTPDLGPSSGISPGSPGFGGFGDTGDMGGPSGSGGMGGDDADGDADACWVAGTQVLMGDCTYRNIEDLKIGDVVMSFPEDKKTRKWTTKLEAKPIISLSVNRSRNIWHLNDTMVTGREWIVKGDGTAALVMWLQEGDTVMGADGEPIDIYRVEAAEGPLSSQITYTFETQNNFSYTADNFRTLRGRAVRAPEDWVYAKDVPTGSMQDEYNKKFSKLAA